MKTKNKIIEIIKNITKKYLKNNYLYMIAFFIYFNITWKWLFTGSISGFFITIGIYTISISIAMSPIGEYILRFVNTARSLETKREKEYLIPLFEDVYEQAKSKYPRLNKNIEICIIDAMYINAVALGRKTVAVTRGAVDTFSEEELKGFISHELGHISNGDTKATLLIIIGNGIFTIPTIALQILLNLLDTVAVIDRKGVLSFIVGLIKLIFNILLFIFSYLMKAIISAGSRENEFHADKFAYDVGYGQDLIEALYLLQGMCISEKANLVTKLTESHPNIAKRIGTLEKMIEEEEESDDDWENIFERLETIFDIKKDKDKKKMM